ncbi:hypothetical protein KQH49_06955 [Mycetohabitans sp. B5]|uniref:hypothetical protein n=1 Tax=Mycetohabitans TaxID=2571159 RepID=UPI001F362C9C|nr:hypothetical protein [Mycetohabitans sp. B5]MCG1054708.1 hypothetical protein [Mycetohabitans sp. B5]
MTNTRGRAVAPTSGSPSGDSSTISFQISAAQMRAVLGTHRCTACPSSEIACSVRAARRRHCVCAAPAAQQRRAGDPHVLAESRDRDPARRVDDRDWGAHSGYAISAVSAWIRALARPAHRA